MFIAESHHEPVLQYQAGILIDVVLRTDISSIRHIERSQASSLKLARALVARAQSRVVLPAFRLDTGVSHHARMQPLFASARRLRVQLALTAVTLRH